MFDHPIHSIFVHFPAALVPVSVIFFALFLFARKQIFELISILLLTISLIFTLLAIASGLYDWQVRYNGFFTQIIAIKFFLSLILFLIGLFIYTYRKTRVKQLGYKSLLHNYIYIFLFFLMVPISATIGYFGSELVYHSSFEYSQYNLDEGSKLFFKRCNTCHPFGQGIKSRFQFPGNDKKDYGTPPLLNSSFLRDKNRFISYLRKPDFMPAFPATILSDENINYIYDYIIYLKNGKYENNKSLSDSTLRDTSTQRK